MNKTYRSHLYRFVLSHQLGDGLILMSMASYRLNKDTMSYPTMKRLDHRLSDILSIHLRDFLKSRTTSQILVHRCKLFKKMLGDRKSCNKLTAHVFPMVPVWTPATTTRADEAIQRPYFLDRWITLTGASNAKHRHDSTWISEPHIPRTKELWILYFYLNLPKSQASYRG